MQGIIVLFVAVVVAAIIYGAYASAQRRKALSAWAQAHNLGFDPGKDDSLDDRFGEFDCLHRGRSRYAHNRIWGDWRGRQLLGFDYHYVTGSGKNRQTHKFSAVILSSELPLKPLFIRPEGFFDKVTEFFGLDDIDFESAEFSRKFFVKSPDKRWAYDVIHQRTMEYLLQAPRFTVKFDRHHVIAFRGKRFAPAEFAAATELIEGILERLPEYVVQQQSHQT